MKRERDSDARVDIGGGGGSGLKACLGCFVLFCAHSIAEERRENMKQGGMQKAEEGEQDLELEELEQRQPSKEKEWEREWSKEGSCQECRETRQGIVSSGLKACLGRFVL